MDAAMRNKNFKRMCRLCNTRCGTRRDQAAHYNSPFHKFMLGIKNTQLSYIGNAKTLNEKITETGKRESFIGLEYIYEYAEDSKGSRMYECKLCDAPLYQNSMFFHIVGIQHRIAYLVKHHPIMGIWAGFEVQSQPSYRKLTNSALAIEQTYGRKKINVVDEVYVPKPNKCDVSDSESASEGSANPEEESSKNVTPDRKAGPNTAKQQNQPLSKESRKARRKRLALARLKASRKNNDVRSRQLESPRDGPRFLLLNDDFDARALHGASNPMSQHDRGDNAHLQGLDDARDAQTRYHDVGSVYQSDNRDMSTFLQGPLVGMAMPYSAAGGTQMLPDTRVGALAQRGLDSVPPYQPAVPPGGSILQLAGGGAPKSQGVIEDLDFRGGNTGRPSYPLERPFQPAPAALPPVGAALQLAGIGVLTSRDDFEDVDFRRMNSNRGGPSALLDKDQNRRRIRSPDPRSRRRRSRFDESCGDVDVRSVLPTGGISFRELKAAHDGNPQGFSSAHLPLCKKKKEKETDSDMEVCSMEFSDCDPEDFWCNEELFDYVKTYQIRDDEGAKFVLKAIKMMSDALIRHKTKKQDLQKRILEEKQKLEEEKKEFFEIKKRKEKSIYATHLRSSEPQNIKLFQEVTGTDMPGSVTDPADQKAAQKPPDKAGPTTAKVTQPQQKTPVSGPAPVVQPAVQKPQAGKNIEPKPLTNFQKSLVDGIKPVVPNPKENNFEPKPLTGFQKALVDGIAPVVQPAIPKSRAKQAQPATLSNKALVSGLGPLLQQLFQRPQDSDNPSNQNPGSRFDNRGPVDGTRALSGPGSGPSQNPPIPGSRFDNPNPRPVTGSAAGGFSGSTQNRGSRFDNMGPVDGTKSVSGPGQNPPIPGSRFDNPNPRPVTGPAAGGYPGGQKPHVPGSRFDNPYPSKEQTPFPAQGGGRYSGPGSLNQSQPSAVQRPQGQNPGTPASKFDNPKLSMDSKTSMGQGESQYSGSDSNFYEDQPFPGSWSDSRGPLDKTKPPIGAGPETRFSQNEKIPGPRFDNPNPSKDPRLLTGQAAGRYSGSETRQKTQIPGSRFDNSNPSNELRPLMGQAVSGYSGSERHFSENPQISGSRFDNPTPSKELRPLMGQATGGYSGSETRFGQNQQTPGSRFDNPNPSKDPRNLTGQAAGAYSDPDAKYKQMPWSSGGQAGSQGFYKETPSPAPGMGAGRYGEQYTQNQWQSQYNSRGGYGSDPQSQQPTGSSGFSSDRPQGTWSSQEPTMTSIYPKSILRNRAGNPP